METTIEILRNQATNTVKDFLREISCDVDGHVMEHVSNILFEAGEYSDDKNYNLQQAFLELLVLLSDPDVSERLPGDLQPTIGEYLKTVMHFFDNLGDGACIAAYALQSAKTTKSEQDLVDIQNRYFKKLALHRSRQ